jgi:hypothetical protein
MARRNSRPITPTNATGGDRMEQHTTREELIAWLEWNDPNGCYNDHDSMIEFGEVATLAELQECYTNQIEG